LAGAPVVAQQSARKAAPASANIVAKAFDTPQQAGDVLVNAAARFDVDVLEAIFGPDGDDVVLTGEYPQDGSALDFAAEAREKKSISVDPKTGNRALLLVGNEDWPFPVPIVKVGDKWHFDAKAGRQELLYRRIGSNELDAIDICRGYVEAQHDYALQKREGYDVNQYAQRIVSSPGQQDGLAWQNADGTWAIRAVPVLHLHYHHGSGANSTGRQYRSHGMRSGARITGDRDILWRGPAQA
jgi:hypothetical protein